MERVLLSQLEQWRVRKGRKPLVLQGARQVGKTWLLKEFGRKCFADVCYVNMEQDPSVAEIFAGSLQPDRVIEQLSLYVGRKINAERTLLIFDEVQEVPRALTSLKYFAEEAPEYAICCAGSLLGVALHKGVSFPVGKVEFMRLEPMSFHEFLIANGERLLAEYIAQGNLDLKAHWERLTMYLKQYMIVGGMPSVVSAWVERHDVTLVDNELQRLLLSYSNDFSKHVPDALEAKIRYIWQSIPSQLARENKKFVYGLVREGARAREFEDALLWMSDAGVIRRSYCVTKPDIPLIAYANLSHFKVFLLDVGLLRAMSRISVETILQGNRIFEEFKGALTEQFALQELAQLPGLEGSYYWTGTKAEVDFLITDGRAVYPLEVKAGINRHAKSLGVYINSYSPAKAFRASLSLPHENKGLIDLPLFAMSALPALIGHR
ncbi:MAG: ATP-binding protein [Muribaculaceae bacterium]|nr:ATP-binding protein [Muribaculaceae bacterium]